jgi:Sugar-specific transcriptional regulator TrmB.
LRSAVQVQIVRMLDKHQDEPPTVSEVADRIHRSVSITYKTLAKLKQKGFVTWDSDRYRIIRLVRP